MVVGIGGSYLGARAVIELLSSPNYNLKVKDTPDIYFAGNGLSTDALLELIALIGDRDFSVNVISKSGTTTEPAVAFRIFKGMLEQKYGKEGARERIYATTDRARGALKGLADQEGYETFVVPDAVGGRYSVLTAVGPAAHRRGGDRHRRPDGRRGPGHGGAVHPRNGQPCLAVCRRPARPV